MTTTMSTGLPNAGMPSTGMPAAAIPTAMPTITRGTPTLGALSSQVALKQQQSVDQLRQPRGRQQLCISIFIIVLLRVGQIPYNHLLV